MKKRVIFLGSPEVAATVLNGLILNTNLGYEIVGVVTAPPARRSRNGEASVTHVHALANKHNLNVLTPSSAKGEEFLKAIEELQPDLCVTAAYGQFLPSKFLAIPKLGTINIHPSLLPLYRGAAPVQRAIENLDEKTGVSLVWTVLKMDAGPIVAQEEYVILKNDDSLTVLDKMFTKGTNILISMLHEIFANKPKGVAQDETKATHTNKISVEEGIVNFNTMSAQSISGKIRAFKPWPGVKVSLITDGLAALYKVDAHRVLDEHEFSLYSKNKVTVTKNSIVIPCLQGASFIELHELQREGKKMLPVKEFINGLKSKEIFF